MSDQNTAARLALLSRDDQNTRLNGVTDQRAALTVVKATIAAAATPIANLTAQIIVGQAALTVVDATAVLAALVAARDALATADLAPIV